MESDSATVEVDSALGEAVSVAMESYTVTVEADLVLGKSDSTSRWPRSLNRRRQRLFTSTQANLAQQESRFGSPASARIFLPRQPGESKLAGQTDEAKDNQTACLARRGEASGQQGF